MSYVGNNGMQKQIMLVIICPQKQKTYNIEVEADTTIGELGNELFSALDCQNDEQCVLYFDGQALQNERTFQDYGIIKGRQIEIKIEKKAQQPAPQKGQLPARQYAQQPAPLNQPNNYIQGNQQNEGNNFMPSRQNEINLTILVGTAQKTYQIRMMKNHQVRELKVKLSNQLKVGPNMKITFIYEGKTLQENKTFESLNITDNAIIYANIEREGGNNH